MSDDREPLAQRVANRIDRMLDHWWAWVILPWVFGGAVTYLIWLFFG